MLFVVDSTDHDRMSEARAELYDALTDGRAPNPILLVFANKQDLPGALSATQVANRLALHTLSWTRWHIQVRDA